MIIIWFILSKFSEETEVSGYVFGKSVLENVADSLVLSEYVKGVHFFLS